MQEFRKLLVWRKSHELTLTCYGFTKDFPADERFGLTSQIRRASASIPTNIAEGCGRSGTREFGHFLNIARGSASELEYLLLLAHDLGLLEADLYRSASDSVTEVKRMLTGLSRRLRTDD